MNRETPIVSRNHRISVEVNDAELRALHAFRFSTGMVISYDDPAEGRTKATVQWGWPDGTVLIQNPDGSDDWPAIPLSWVVEGGEPLAACVRRRALECPQLPIEEIQQRCFENGVESILAACKRVDPDVAAKVQQVWKSPFAGCAPVK